MAADDLDREVLRRVGLRVLRELAEGAVSDETRFKAAANLVEWATSVEWTEKRHEREVAKEAREAAHQAERNR
jgi:hypothetical protein